jgi:hypothetical protein
MARRPPEGDSELASGVHLAFANGERSYCNTPQVERMEKRQREC